MRKRLVPLVLLMGTLMIAGCAKTSSEDSETEGEYVGTVIMAEYSGTITDFFTDEDTGKDCITVNTETEEITFTLIDSTSYIGAEEVAVGDTVRISCEEYSNSDYHPVIEITIVE